MIKDNKDSAVEFITLLIEGQIDEAYDSYVDMKKGKHHNLYFSRGFQALKDAMKADYEQVPDKKLTIMNIIGDNDLVAIHSKLVMGNGGKEISVVHILRFEEGKVVEMWDVGQEVPDDMPNEDGAF